MQVYSTHRQGSVQSRRGFPYVQKLGRVLLSVTTTALLILQVAGWLNAQDMFALKEIVVEGNRLVKTPEILSVVGSEESGSLFQIDLDKVKTRVAQHPFIKSVSVTRRLPHNLLIKVREQQPIAILNDGRLPLIDETGKQLPPLVKPSVLDYPVILKSGFENKNGAKTLIAFLNFVKRHDFALCCQISEISFSDDLGVYFYLMDQNVPVIMGTENFAERCEKLKPVLSLLRQENALTQVRSLDLRYEGRVIMRELATS